MALRSPARFIKTYRWQELGLFIIPFIILLLVMTQLLLARLVRAGLVQTSSLSVKNLPTVEGLLTVFCIIVAFVFINIVLNIFFPKTGQGLFPLVGLLCVIAAVNALR